MTSKLARFVTWAAYLFLPFIAKIALGRLTVVHIDNPENPADDVELEGLLAPLLLMQLGYPDGITAYAWEDNGQGLRQILNVGAVVVIVVRILIRCWDGSSPASRLYFPLFTAGLINSAMWVWALKSVNDVTSIVNAEYLPKETKELSVHLRIFDLDERFDSAKEIMRAYFRFDCLKPHLARWPYHPVFVSRDLMSIDSYTPDRAFTVSEIELNFMFDVLYTKAAVLYTKQGLIGRFLGILCLVSTLCVFAVIFKNTFLIDFYFTYTYALLMAVVSLELYKITTWAFSDWAVVVMGMMNPKVPLVSRLLPFLADRCMKKKRWSRSIGQLNLIEHCRFHKERSKPVNMVLDWFAKYEINRKWLHSRKPMPSCLRALVLRKMAELEEKRNYRPFNERGKWTLEIYDVRGKQALSDSIEAKFANSIIIWHIATEILQSSESEKSDAYEGSKILSKYMMYHLALQPYILSLPDLNIPLENACHTLRTLLRYRDYNDVINNLSSLDGDFPHPVEPSSPTRITSQWDMLSEVQKLVVDLKTMDNKWELISSIWVEMLCHAAFKCHVYNHAKLLRRGGEFITHVWLLLAHKTDNFPYENPEACRKIPEMSLLGRRFF
ncbi:hypothetical protein BT93_E2365 [Corymbia citriodora subsp. variegata]|nr:hypothetical protein BT93_E2365 [Corymbia citriodora subsp. variegata]